MTEDARAARLLVAEKEAFRELEAAATTAHFGRLRARAGQGKRRGRGGAGGRGGGGSALHLDLLREFKRLNAHLVAAAAYPVLEGQGELLSSRLRADSVAGTSARLPSPPPAVGPAARRRKSQG